MELFFHASGEDENAVCIDIIGEPTGLICAIAGQQFASLEYNRDYTAKEHSTLGFERTFPSQSLTSEPLIFVDDTNVLSSIPPEWLISVVDAANAVAHIIAHNDLPDQLKRNLRG